MEAMVKKYQHKFKRVQDDMDRWDDLQSRLVSQFRNASSIIGRLKLLEDPKKYGSLKNLDNVKEGILTKQMESLQTIILSMTKTLGFDPLVIEHKPNRPKRKYVKWFERGESHLHWVYMLKHTHVTNPNVDRQDLNSVVFSLAKAYRDAKQQLKGCSVQISAKQLNNRIGIKPTLADCLEGLRLLHEMYQSEYMLKSSVFSALNSLALKPSVSDLHALEQLLVDQPNISKDEVQSIYDIIFAEDIC